jgi:hypothetical protein
MSVGTAQRPDDDLEIFHRLAAQFVQNQHSALSIQFPEIGKVELKARCLASVGELMRDKCAASSTQKLIATIYDEVFADFVCSIYLAAQGLDKPAQLVLRRALELGLAAFYLWDQPHLFWGWKEFDQDLSFTDIVAHLSAPSYLKFVAAEIGSPESSQLFDATLARNEYRALSNVAHGKLSTFESPLVDRFRHSDEDWRTHLHRLETIQDVLINFATKRFVQIRDSLPSLQPQLTLHS